MNLILGFSLFLFVAFAYSDVCKHEASELNHLDVKKYQLGNVSYTCKCIADGSAPSTIICSNDCVGCTYDNDTCLQDGDIVTDTFFNTEYKCTCNSLVNQFECETTTTLGTCDGCFYNKLCLTEGQKVNVETMLHYLPCICSQRKLVCQDIYHNYQLGKQPYFQMKPLKYFGSKEVSSVTENSFEDIELPLEAQLKEKNSEKNNEDIHYINAGNSSKISNIKKDNVTVDDAIQKPSQKYRRNSQLMITAEQSVRTHGIIKKVTERYIPHKNGDSITTESLIEEETAKELAKRYVIYASGGSIQTESVTAKDTKRQVTHSTVAKKETPRKLVKRDVTHPGNNVTAGPGTAKDTKRQVIHSTVGTAAGVSVAQKETPRKLAERDVTHPGNNSTAGPGTAKDTKRQVIHSTVGTAAGVSVAQKETPRKLAKRDVAHPGNNATAGPGTGKDTKRQDIHSTVGTATAESVAQKETPRKLAERDVTHPGNNATAGPGTAKGTKRQIPHSTVGTATGVSVAQKETPRKLAKRDVTHPGNNVTVGPVTAKDTIKKMAETHSIYINRVRATAESHTEQETTKKVAKRNVNYSSGDNVTLEPVRAQETKELNKRNITYTSGDSITAEPVTKEQRIIKLSKRHITYSSGDSVTAQEANKLAKKHFTYTIKDRIITEPVTKQEIKNKQAKRYVTPMSHSDIVTAKPVAAQNTMVLLAKGHATYDKGESVIAEPVETKKLANRYDTYTSGSDVIPNRVTLQERIEKMTKSYITRNGFKVEAVTVQGLIKKLVKKHVTHSCKDCVTSEPVTQVKATKEHARKQRTNNLINLFANLHQSGPVSSSSSPLSISEIPKDRHKPTNVNNIFEKALLNREKRDYGLTDTKAKNQVENVTVSAIFDAIYTLKDLIKMKNPNSDSQFGNKTQINQTANLNDSLSNQDSFGKQLNPNSDILIENRTKLNQTTNLNDSLSNQDSFGKQLNPNSDIPIENITQINQTTNLNDSLSNQDSFGKQLNPNSDIPIENITKLNQTANLNDSLSNQDSFGKQLNPILPSDRTGGTNQDPKSDNKVEQHSDSFPHLPSESQIKQADSVNSTNQDANIITNVKESQINKNASETNDLVKQEILNVDLLNKTDASSTLTDAFSLANKTEILFSPMNHFIPTASSPKSIKLPSLITNSILKQKILTKNGTY